MPTFTGQFAIDIPVADRIYVESSGGNDDANIRNALDQAGAKETGGVVFLSDSRYRADHLKIPSRVALVGASRSCHIRQNGNINLPLIKNYSLTDEQITLQNLTLDGNRENQTDEDNAHAIHIESADNAADFFATTILHSPDPAHNFLDLKIMQVRGDGIRISGRGSHILDRLRINGVSGMGIDMSSSDNMVSNTQIGGIGKKGVMDRKGGNAYTTVKVYFCGQKVGYLEGDAFATGWGAWRVYFANCEAQDTHRHGWLLRGEGAVLSACASDAIGALFPRHGMGDPAPQLAAAITMEDAQHNHITAFMHMDRHVVFGGHQPTAENIIRFLPNARDNKVEVLAAPNSHSGPALHYVDQNNHVELDGERVL